MTEYALHCGDCLDVLPTLDAGSVDAVITDPPWGINLDTDYTRFVNGLHDNHRHTSAVMPNRARIIGDDAPFDPSPWLSFPRVILWGMNHFSNMLPSGGCLVWLKKRDSQIGTFLSDAEIAWVSGITGVYVYRHIWHGYDRQNAHGTSVLHPTQKPVELMEWCIEKYTNPGDLILDPFMGSGTTGVAAMLTGRRFIGIELDPGYFAIAQRRIAKAAQQARGEFVTLNGHAADTDGLPLFSNTGD